MYGPDGVLRSTQYPVFLRMYVKAEAARKLHDDGFPQSASRVSFCCTVLGMLVRPDRFYSRSL